MLKKDLKYSIQCSNNLKEWEEIWNSENWETSLNVVSSIDNVDFTLFTITNTGEIEENSNIFFRILVQYLETNLTE